jgi:hypothetical protein
VLHSCCTLAILVLHSLVALVLHSPCTRVALLLHSCCTRVALLLHSRCTRCEAGPVWYASADLAAPKGAGRRPREGRGPKPPAGARNSDQSSKEKAIQHRKVRHVTKQPIVYAARANQEARQSNDRTNKQNMSCIQKQASGHPSDPLREFAVKRRE